MRISAVQVYVILCILSEVKPLRPVKSIRASRMAALAWNLLRPISQKILDLYSKLPKWAPSQCCSFHEKNIAYDLKDQPKITKIAV